ncbi:mitochondrial K+-H+ exchange-related-domain-containing protein [Phlyctochytrium arcticum]|nr:mitochondrial K+-H+ exchange-related-domain-containing protein [Phlyctochytrium arcticum]
MNRLGHSLGSRLRGSAANGWSALASSPLRLNSSSTKTAAIPPAHTHLKVFILPTLHNKHAFHARFLPPRTPFERSAIVMAYVLRKWRYQISDTFAFMWHGMGSGSTGIGRRIWALGNRAVTRRAADEYFLKTVPRITEHIEFIYPASANSRVIKSQLGDFLSNSGRHRQKLFLWALILPSSLYIAKVYVVLANLFFSYNVFRLNASWRSQYGAKTLQKLLDSKQVTWTSSQELDDQIKVLSDEVTSRMKKEDGPVWQWTPTGDLHDEVVEGLEAQLKAVELARTYRRARMQYLVHNGKEV